MAQSYVLNIGEVVLRPFDARNDTDDLTRIIGQIWSGGNNALTESQYGLIGGKSWGHWQAKEIMSYISAAQCSAYTAVEAGKTIGFCSYVLDRERLIGTVGYNGLAPEQQGRKLGSAMMDFVMRKFNEEGMLYAAVIVMNNPQHAPARRVYESHGFKTMVGLDYMFRKL